MTGKYRSKEGVIYDVIWMSSKYRRWLEIAAEKKLGNRLFYPISEKELE